MFTKVMILFTFQMILGGIGAWLGRKLESLFSVILLAVLFLGGAFCLAPAAHAGVGVGVVVLGIWTFISGLFIGPSIEMYAEDLGWETVSMAFFGTGGVMAACGAFGMLSGYDFSGLGKILCFALLGLIVVGVVGLFIRMSRETNIIYSLLGCVIFAGFFIFDFFRINKSQNTWENAILLSANIYLDFVNFFLHLLRLLAAAKRH